MQYDPIKRKLGAVFNRTPAFRKLFYRMLDLLLLRSWHIRKEFRQIEREKSGSLTVLDAGSGFGQYVYYMARRHKDWHIKGVDVKQEQIADCNIFFDKIGLKNTRFAEADLSAFDEKETYDLILCVDVMEHIEEDERVLTNFYGAIKKGGMLLISTPSDQGGSDVHDVRDGYGIREIADKMKRAGFSKTEVYYQYGPSGKLAWKLSMKYPIIILNASYLLFIILPFYYLLTFPLVLILNYFDVKGNHTTGTGLIAKGWKQV